MGLTHSLLSMPFGLWSGGGAGLGAERGHDGAWILDQGLENKVGLLLFPSRMEQWARQRQCCRVHCSFEILTTATVWPRGQLQPYALQTNTEGTCMIIRHDDVFGKEALREIAACAHSDR